jgi:N-acetylglucosaminyldiphosphoundecaprenol N-acetyl-beta-D-mannosaminyltransferase
MNIDISKVAIKPIGVNVNRLSAEELYHFICTTITNSKQRIISNHNSHSIYLYHHDEKMRSFYARSACIVIDSMPLVFIGRFLGCSLRRENRMTHVDWIPPLLTQAAEKEWRVFYLGSKPGVAEQGVQIWRSKIPKLEIAVHHGYFDIGYESSENQQVIAAINAYRPQILMVGMGMPRQEHWIIDNLHQLNTNVIINVGALIDYVAGVIPTPPRWMGPLGIEWLYRLVSEPGRLGRRYLLEPWFLIMIIIKNLIKK